MIKTALFPYYVNTLPVVKYINKYSKNYKITTLLAFPGSGLCKKDAGYTDNRGKTGMVVYESLNETKNMWDVIFIADLPDYEGEAYIHEMTIEMIKKY